MIQFPPVSFQQKRFLFHLYAVALCKRFYNLLKLFFVRRAKVNRDAETGHQRQLFRHRIAFVQIILPLLLVTELLPDKMPSVGSRINQHILRLLFQTALNDGF